MCEKHKYKVGDRFVIEIKELPMSSDGAYYWCDGNTFYPEETLNHLPHFPNGEDANDLYMLTQEEKQHIEEKAYNAGINEAWEIARELCKTGYDECKTMFGQSEVEPVIKDFSPREVKERLNLYRTEKEKREKEIHVGDVVTYESEHEGHTNAVVISISNNPNPQYNNLYCMRNDGSIICQPITFFEKTDRHIDLTDILEQI